VSAKVACGLASCPCAYRRAIRCLPDPRPPNGRQSPWPSPHCTLLSASPTLLAPSVARAAHARMKMYQQPTSTFDHSCMLFGLSGSVVINARRRGRPVSPFETLSTTPQTKQHVWVFVWSGVVVGALLCGCRGLTRRVPYVEVVGGGGWDAGCVCFLIRAGKFGCAVFCKE
jgi:hypothetical protein